MMRLTIIAVGRHKAGPLKALQEFYAERIRWPLTIREVEERRKLSPAEDASVGGAEALPTRLAHCGRLAARTAPPGLPGFRPWRFRQVWSSPVP